VSISKTLPTTQLPTLHSRRTRFLVTHPCPNCGRPPENVNIVRDEAGEVSGLLERGLQLRWWSDTNEIECVCGKTFMCPERLYKPQTPKAKKRLTQKPAAVPVKKPVKKAANSKSKPRPKSTPVAKLNPEPQSYKDYIRQLDADPLEGIINADCRRFFLSIFKPRSCFRGVISNNPRSREHCLADFGRCIFYLEPIQKDQLEFRRCLDRGTADEKLIDELTSKTHCSKFIRDTESNIHKAWNAQELSIQLAGAYSKEIERHRKARRTAIEIEVEQAECHVTQKKAAQFLGRHERTMRNKRYLRCEHGKISTALLKREKNSQQ